MIEADAATSASRIMPMTLITVSYLLMTAWIMSLASFNTEPTATVRERSLRPWLAVKREIFAAHVPKWRAPGGTRGDFGKVGFPRLLDFRLSPVIISGAMVCLPEWP
jgi:hypothetical protein